MITLAFLAVFACTPDDDADDTGVDATADSDSGSDSDSGGDSDSATDTVDTAECPEFEEPGAPATRDTGDGPRAAHTLDGTVTWTLSFDDDAEAAGYRDCTYTRQYTEFTESTLHGHLCPECSLLTRGFAEVIDGYDDCFAQISTADAIRPEALGLAEVDGAWSLFRSGSLNVSLGDMGPITGDPTGSFAVAWTDESALDEGGTMVLSAAGTLQRATSATATVPDPDGARAEPYSCGWPQNSPGGANASYDVAIGKVLPNVRLEDQCGEPVDVWDFRGWWLVIDAAATNCGPCQAMAAEADAFEERMRNRCVPVKNITLLAESLSAINVPATIDVRQDWAATFGVSSPVLGDEGFGYALFPDILGDTDGGMSYPTVVVVDPDGLVVWAGTGFGGWEEVEAIILGQ